MGVGGGGAVTTNYIYQRQLLPVGYSKLPKKLPTLISTPLPKPPLQNRPSGGGEQWAARGVCGAAADIPPPAGRSGTDPV